MFSRFLTFLLFIFCTFSNAQTPSQIENKLYQSFNRINYWSDDGRSQNNSGDSLYVANKNFENLLLKYTSINAQTLAYRFSKLTNEGLKIATSEDGKFRIYSWDTATGGTMRFFRNVYQYKNVNKVFSNVIDFGEDDAGAFYYQINDVISQNKKYYLAQKISILSSALSYHAVQIFSIEGNILNQNAKLIKTKSGIQNQLGYEVDFSASVNRNNTRENYGIEYDVKKKIISIPLIQADSKLTDKKIRYQFKGKYFEKL